MRCGTRTRRATARAAASGECNFGCPHMCRQLRMASLRCSLLLWLCLWWRPATLNCLSATDELALGCALSELAAVQAARRSSVSVAVLDQSGRRRSRRRSWCRGRHQRALRFISTYWCHELNIDMAFSRPVQPRVGQPLGPHPQVRPEHQQAELPRAGQGHRLRQGQ